MYLNAGSVSVAVDRLHSRGLVARVERHDDRRIRTISLTSDGKKLITRVFLKHSALIEELLAPLSAPERKQLKRIGKPAEAAIDDSRPCMGTRSALILGFACSASVPTDLSACVCFVPQRPWTSRSLSNRMAGR